MNTKLRHFDILINPNIFLNFLLKKTNAERERERGGGGRERDMMNEEREKVH